MGRAEAATPRRGEARRGGGSRSSCGGSEKRSGGSGSGAGEARERAGEEEAVEGRGRLLVFGAGGGSHSCSCTSGRHFVLRGSERDTHRILPPPPLSPIPPRPVPTHPAQAAPSPALPHTEGAAAAPWQRCFPGHPLASPRLGVSLGTGSARPGPG